MKLLTNEECEQYSAYYHKLSKTNYGGVRPVLSEALKSRIKNLVPLVCNLGESQFPDCGFIPGKDYPMPYGKALIVEGLLDALSAGPMDDGLGSVKITPGAEYEKYYVISFVGSRRCIGYDTGLRYWSEPHYEVEQWYGGRFIGVVSKGDDRASLTRMFLCIRNQDVSLYSERQALIMRELRGE